MSILKTTQAKESYGVFTKAGNDILKEMKANLEKADLEPLEHLSFQLTIAEKEFEFIQAATLNALEIDRQERELIARIAIMHNASQNE
jgi:hypothetical protein